jgi:DNA repair photolyase
MSQTTRFKAALSILSATLLLSASQVGFGQAAADDGARREAVELRIEELKERLELTPEQESRLAPIIEARNARLRELRSSAGGDTSRRARMAALKEARKVQADFSAQIAPILTREQQDEWEEIREEVRAAAKERMRERR